MNEHLEDLDPEEERKKLCKQNRNIKLAEEIYSLCYRSCHAKSAQLMCLDEKDKLFAFEASIFAFVVQILFVSVIVSSLVNSKDEGVCIPEE